MSKHKEWRGLKDLLIDAVEQGTSAVERVHLEIARRSFFAVKQVPAIREPTQNVESLYNSVVAATYASVRAVTRTVGSALDVAIDALEAADDERGAKHAAKPGSGDGSQ
jgi:hypothetical protein